MVAGHDVAVKAETHHQKESAAAGRADVDPPGMLVGDRSGQGRRVCGAGRNAGRPDSRYRPGRP